MANALIFDNVQHFQRQRDLRIGRENMMIIIGIAATFFKFEVNLLALDYLDKRNRILHSRRPTMTVYDLLKLIDQPHLRKIGVLQFIEALPNYIPEADIYQLPPGKTAIYPLATSGKNEASITELKDGFLDFLEQLGQTDGDYDRRLFFGGGDGMSYNNMLLMQKYLQNHTDPFQSFELLRPVLQLWHTFWTDLWRAPPANLKKVDYYPTAQFLSLVHDMRILDCWSVHFGTDDIFEYFAALKRTNSLPSFKELENTATQLFDTYVASSSRYQVKMDARDSATEWTTCAPLGSLWDELPPAPAPVKLKKKKKKKLSAPSTKTPPKKKQPLPEPPVEFNGDQVEFDDGTFMYDAMIPREAAAAAAQGDVGRVWEALKAMLFTFAGSAHSKYMGYLLEMVADLELESNPFLKDASLMSMVLSPDGKAGNCKPCDIFQELLNRCIDPVVQRKDTNYGSHHVRTVWSRNIKDIYDLKNDFRAAIGLSKRTGRHKKPHEHPEVKILLREYRHAELHKRRPGPGFKHLEGGVLKKWAKRTTNNRIRHLQHNENSSSTDITDQPSDSEHESDWSDESDEEDVPMTLGDMTYENGRLEISIEEDGDDDFMAGLVADDEETDEDSDSE
ncbi:hypothetical protein DFH06DRAFT_1266807 [Mycena polygramma]|nr:hypothetical protein DFH06DRAFT_1266807 [Mycena polygramma]